MRFLVCPRQSGQGLINMLGRWRISVGMLCVVGCAALAGCGVFPFGSAPGPPSPGGSSGAQSTRAGAGQLSPCALLSSVQRRQLAVSQGVQQQATDDLGGVACVWSRFPVGQGVQYEARLISGPVPAGMPSASINNLPTAEYRPPNVDPRTQCVYLVTLSSNQTLWVQFADTKGFLPGMSHQVACQRAQAAVVSMTRTFGALTT